MASNDINRAEDYFRRSKDKGGDDKLLARGLLHLIKFLEFTDGRDFGRAVELLDQSWKKIGQKRKMSEAMFLVARELKKAKGKKRGRVKANLERNEFGLLVKAEKDED